MVGPKPITFFKNNSVMATDAAQLGIKPIRAVKNGCQKILLAKKLVKKVSPR